MVAAGRNGGFLCIPLKLAYLSEQLEQLLFLDDHKLCLFAYTLQDWIHLLGIEIYKEK
ncbi:MAG TPA: hypothetical protein PK028_03030 [Bacteroidales bacterium]|nr:hypothetical protein [Bacteroidales bacterium]MDI9574378.1 hypothetical protein [Bacteroidota bacterium]MBP9587857.1 hypothetical protein [Bacteroidales bacterium]NMD15251.1 hypothetical protein [Bacteroidales bacterium]HOE58765.1 hypothetical protein [Bacteroidales bacterium]